MTSGPETSTALQRASPESKALVIGVERAYVALRDARNDFERLIVRDKAQAIAAAAEVLKRRDIQTEASILVASAEREIAKANPPIPPEQRSPGRGGNTVTANNDIPDDISKGNLRQIRQAHDKLTDEQFAAASEKAREQGEPLTRTALKREARKLNPPEQDDSDEPKPPTQVERLQARVDELAMKLQLKDRELVEKDREVEDLKVKVQWFKDQGSEYEIDHYQRVNAQQARIRTLEGRVDQLVTEKEDARRLARWWRSQAERLGWKANSAQPAPALDIPAEEFSNDDYYRDECVEEPA